METSYFGPENFGTSSILISVCVHYSDGSFLLEFIYTVSREEYWKATAKFGSLNSLNAIARQFLDSIYMHTSRLLEEKLLKCIWKRII